MREFNREAMDPEGYWKKNATFEEFHEYYGDEVQQGGEDVT